MVKSTWYFIPSPLKSSVATQQVSASQQTTDSTKTVSTLAPSPLPPAFEIFPQCLKPWGNSEQFQGWTDPVFFQSISSHVTLLLTTVWGTAFSGTPAHSSLPALAWFDSPSALFIRPMMTLWADRASSLSWIPSRSIPFHLVGCEPGHTAGLALDSANWATVSLAMVLALKRAKSQWGHRCSDTVSLPQTQQRARWCVIHTSSVSLEGSKSWSAGCFHCWNLGGYCGSATGCSLRPGLLGLAGNTSGYAATISSYHHKAEKHT